MNRGKLDRAYELIIEHMKHEMSEGNLERGQKLPPERELAEQLGVGRNTVREAMRSLGLLGFISSSQGAGNYITCDFQKNFRESMHMMLLMNEISIQDVVEFRHSLELYSAKLAQDRITWEQFQELEICYENLKKADTFSSYIRYNTEFHTIIVMATKNKLLVQLLQGLISLLNENSPEIEKKVENLMAYKEEFNLYHGRIIEAIRRCNNDEIEKAIGDHTNLVSSMILE